MIMIIGYIVLSTVGYVAIIAALVAALARDKRM